MAKLIEVLEAARELSGLLFSKAGDATFALKVQQAFKSDGFMIVNATQALTLKPAHGHGDDPGYDASLRELTQAFAAVDIVVNTATSINKARLEVVHAATAMGAVTGI